MSTPAADLPLRPEDLAYELPPGRIAQVPSARREAARLLVVRRGSGGVRHAGVADLPGLLTPGSLLVLNDTRVIPARLIGRRAETGGRCELLLVRPREGDGVPAGRWSVLVSTRGRLRPGEPLEMGAVAGTYVGTDDAGGHLADLRPARDGETMAEALERGGAVPLPPYIRRAPEPGDRERYQTVYAEAPGAVAAPTAGLHLGTELLAALAARGIATARVTLHVGPGTFRPMKGGDPSAHRMEAERIEVTAEAAAAVNDARDAGRPVIAVGTTVVRTLESVAARDADGRIAPCRGDADLFVLPGHRFRAIDGLLTNFHLPRSTLLALVMAFHGIARTREAYAAAVAGGYRFYSYGDAMAVLPATGGGGG